MFDMYFYYKLYFLLSIPFIVLLATFFHYTYKLSNNSLLVGIFTPVNESIWEHLKLAVYPTIIWYIISYIIFNNIILDWKKWFSACTISMIISSFIIVIFYYTYTGALGIHSLILDIFSLILGVIIGQYIAFKAYANYDLSNTLLYFSLFILTVFLFTLFTFIPPKIPLFIDSTTGKYGINN
ncbi:DUF6512 family protein [Clostridium taeniosporum]|uniref:Uncharacterized protein n=1 Tax=Clostridium taeniosporum TaxID=394958 RepID=A0A1D7XHI2_9CLOT|nr:DUF6512 family protein [Clostridium taeniosporum]AOR22786.1 hypothetical protein BGI42_03245 [Clostridium taeniosporum]